MSYEGFFPGALPAFIDTHAPDTFVASECSGVVYVHNPYSTRRNETPEAIARMQRAGSLYGLELTMVETSPDIQGNKDMLQQSVDEDSLIVVRTGDGGLNKMLSAIRALGLQNPVKAEAGGHMNDIVRQVASKKSLRDPEYALAHSVVHLLRPVEVTITEADGSEQKVDAYGYFSAGVTDEVAEIAASEPWRKAQRGKGPVRRKIADSIMAARSLATAKSYELGVEGEAPQEAIDIIIANGNTMAGNIHPRQNILEPDFRIIHVRNRLGGLATLGATMVRLPAGKKVGPGIALELEISGRQKNQGQVDGDILEWGDGAKLRAQTAETGVNMLVDRSKA